MRRAAVGVRCSSGLGGMRTGEKGAFFGTGGLDDGLGWGEFKMIVLKSFGLLAVGQDRVGKLFERRTSDRRHKWICSVVQKPARLDV